MSPLPPNRHLFDRFLREIDAALQGMPAVMTYKDLASAFRTSVLFWKVAVRKGTAPKSFKIGANRRFARADVLEWVADRMIEASPESVPSRPVPYRRPLPPPA